MSKGQDIGRIILWSGISNAVLASLFIAALNWGRIEAVVLDLMKSRETVVARTHDPLAAARLQRRNVQQGFDSVQSAKKTSLGLTRIQISGTYNVAPTENVTPAESVTGEVLEDTTAVASAADAGPTTEEVQGMRAVPILRMDQKSGQLEIGNFKSMTMVGDAGECLDMGYSMLGDAGTSSDVLEVMAQSDMITVAKICTRNGLVMLTCRNQQITISPRHSRPDDRCPSLKQ